MNRSELAGLRCVGLARCSTPGQTENSIPQQLTLLRQFADQQELIWVGEETAEGVSGSRTDHRDDLDRLMERKRTLDDYDVLLVQDYTRLTRGGADHGGHVLYKFAEIGVQVVSANDDIPDNEYAPIIRNIMFVKARGQAQAISFATTRGAQASIEEGRCTYTRCFPYGIDRMVLSASGEKLFRLRNLSDGTQLKLHTDHDTVLHRFPRNPKKGIFKHHLKQKDERVVLCTGDPERVAAVRRMYHMHYVEGIGTPLIASALNVSGPPPHEGGRWNACTIYSILHNPIYVGRGIANVLSTGIFHQRNPKSPMPAKRRKEKRSYRPPSEWIITEHPQLDFVPPEIREMVWQRQYERMVRRVENVKGRRARGPASNSPWIMLGAIFQKDTNVPLQGFRTGPKMAHRYYMLRAARQNPHPGEKAHLFPAPPIEEAVRNVVRDVLSDIEKHRDEIERRASQLLAATNVDGMELERLREERDKLREKKAFALDEFTDLGPELLRKRIEPLTAQIKSLDHRIAAADNVSGRPLGSPSDIADAIIKQIKSMDLSTEGSTTPLRNFLSTITRTEVDLGLRQARVEVRLPDWAVVAGIRADLCKPAERFQKRSINTQPEDALIFAEYTCIREVRNRHACMTCRRELGKTAQKRRSVA